MQKRFFALTFVLAISIAVFVIYVYTGSFTCMCTTDTRPMLNPQTGETKFLPTACCSYLESAASLMRNGWVDCEILNGSGCTQVMNMYEHYWDYRGKQLFINK